MALSRSIFVGDTISWRCEAAGDVEIGVVDASLPGVAEGVSRLLVLSIEDARSDSGGHLPGWLVDDIERNYISPEKVRTLWAPTGHRFAMLAGGEIIGTVHVGKSHDVILTADRWHNNVAAGELPGLKPDRHHQVVNVSVLHELRRAGLAARLFDAVTTTFRHLFDGDGLWVRADPPWHPWLARLGFAHDPSFDVFLPESVERTSGLAHSAFNVLHGCACDGAHASARTDAMRSQKLQYVSFTRAFGPVRTSAAPRPRTFTEHVPASVEALVEVVAQTSREGRRFFVRGAGSGSAAHERTDAIVSTRALDRVTVAEDHVLVGGGATWRSLLAALPAGLLPPVVPGYVDATIGGSLSTGGIGKGSVEVGLAIDHVRELVVVTRDGRRVTCSAEREAWLFEAVLGGCGVFGVIAEATLPLVPRRARVVLEKTIVPREALASALEVTAYHAFATRTDEGWLAIVARESEEEGAGVPIAAFVAPQRPVRAITSMFQAFFDAPGLERFLSADVDAQEVTVHPLRRSGSTTYAVTITTDAPSPTLAERALACGGRLATAVTRLSSATS